MNGSVVAVAWLVDVGRVAREAGDMFWETLWALVLGFTLSGAVQTFVSTAQMRNALGDHGARSVSRASILGAASSSCSYAAAAMARSLFAKGADFVAAVVFMFASTNLVIELGIVVVVLLGWQFLGAQFLGGLLMIGLLATVGALLLRGPMVERARSRQTEEGGSSGPHGHCAAPALADHCAAPAPAGGQVAGALGIVPSPILVNSGDGHLSTTAVRAEPRGTTLVADDHAESVATPSAPPISWWTRAGWGSAARAAWRDASMIRTELVIGYVVAGALAVLVPAAWWDHVFLRGHGVWTVIENALVGPLVAVASCVCSIGNVPLAATLWGGGISFGGVVAFLFADLLALPLLFVYRRYYGTRLTLRLGLVFYAVMVVTGLLVQGVFGLVGAVPAHHGVRLTTSGPGWNLTTALDVVFLGVALALWRVARHAPANRGHGPVVAA